MKYYIIAGEASGDLHGSNLVKGLLEKDPSAQIHAWGGELMRQAGAEVVKDYRENSIMGFVEVVANIGKILGNMKECCKDILAFNPDVVILIDYPGFNMKIAKFANKHGFKVFYYIAPKVWAWKERRVHKIKRFVDKLFIIFPFEVEYFRKWGIETVYRGNPLLDSVCNFSHAGESRAAFEARTSPKRQVICTTATEPATAAAAMPIIAALAGSRKMEIGFLLPRIVRTALAMPQYRFIIAAAPSMEPEYLKKIIQKELAAAGAPAGTSQAGNNKTQSCISHTQAGRCNTQAGRCNIEIMYGETYAVLQQSVAAIISSGTASLEAALLKTPQVVCYGGNPISFYIAKAVVKLKYISLANLILDKLIFKEILQNDCTPANISAELEALINQKTYRDAMLADYDKVHQLLGGGGASGRIAEAMIEELK
ncbi:MAG: lipid-A-disaccharide synthase [Candidatus Egerieousia sp.]|nr:lipid-A-disaccharide synthase [Candidatus Egerieousia sp.]